MATISSIANIETVVTGLIPMYMIIISGALSVYFKILSPESAAFLSQYVFYFSVPALLFLDIAKTSAHINSMRWDIILATFVGSLVVWAVVALIYIIVHRKSSQAFGMAGIMSLCCTFSSSIFTSYPILKSLDEADANGHDYAIYCSICFVVWNITIVPLSILLCETYMLRKKREDGSSPRLTFQEVCAKFTRAILRSFVNPVVAPVLLGIVVWTIRSYTNPSKYPQVAKFAGNIISNWASTIGKATTGTALFCIGMSMYGKTILGDNLFETLALIVAKQFVTPMIVLGFLYASTKMIYGYLPDQKATVAAYLINMVPPAQVTYLLSVQYKGIGLTQVSSGLVFGGIVNFPLIYISMSLLQIDFGTLFIPRMDFSESLLDLLRATTCTMSIISIFAAVYTLLPSLFDRKYKNSLRRLVAALCCSQVMTSIMFGIGTGLSLFYSKKFFVENPAFCATQGFLLQFFTGATMTYFCMISVHLLIKFIFRVKVRYYIEVMYHLVAWGFGLITACLPIGLYFIDPSYGFGPGPTWCWMTNVYLQLVAFYAPFAIYAIVGIFTTISILYSLRNFARGLPFKSPFGKKGGFGLGMPVGKSTQPPNVLLMTLPTKFDNMRLQLIWKCIFFNFVFMITWGWGFLNRFTQLFTDQKRIYILVFLHTTMSGAQGLSTFIVFGTGKAIFNDYRIVLKRITAFGNRVVQVIKDKVFGRRSSFALAGMVAQNKKKKKRSVTMIDNGSSINLNNHSIALDTDDEEDDEEAEAYEYDEDDDDATYRDVEEDNITTRGVTQQSTGAQSTHSHVKTNKKAREAAAEKKERRRRTMRATDGDIDKRQVREDEDDVDEATDNDYLFSNRMLRKLTLMSSDIKKREKVIQQEQQEELMEAEIGGNGSSAAVGAVNSTSGARQRGASRMAIRKFSATFLKEKLLDGDSPDSNASGESPVESSRKPSQQQLTKRASRAANFTTLQEESEDELSESHFDDDPSEMYFAPPQSSSAHSKSHLDLEEEQPKSTSRSTSKKYKEDDSSDASGGYVPPQLPISTNTVTEPVSITVINSEMQKERSSYYE